MSSRNTLTIYKLLELYDERKMHIAERLKQFAEFYKHADDKALFEELVFCICAAGYSARGAMRCVEAIRPILMHADAAELAGRMHFHRFASTRAKYIFHTREYLRREFNFKLKEVISSLDDHHGRRDFLALNRDIKGIGYKEASHFLRNIGFKGYAILDRHVVRCLFELGVLGNDKPPNTRGRYIEAEERAKAFSQRIGLTVDELDLLLWSYRTGEILK
ncbi:MAG: N-glycosylase/DNA lyase [Armatimonadota bacterium]|nr:N-glycosylase/DNA lyase [Armatimonadota bacterium]MCX7777064.1 N-glycosylase/DNA lyase [Armatimonadota bacterium]MDW8024866.1 N-glycosylase/DNA lyase [Armatimonadota bacterium]